MKARTREQWAEVEADFDSLIAAVRSDAFAGMKPEYDPESGERLLLNAYGRACYRAGQASKAERVPETRLDAEALASSINLALARGDRTHLGTVRPILADAVNYYRRNQLAERVPESDNAQKIPPPPPETPKRDEGG